MADDKNFELADRPVCSVMMDDKVQVSDDFIAILADETGHAQIFYYTDAVTLGMGIKMMAHEYLRLVRELSAEDAERVVDFLGPEFAPERLGTGVEDAVPAGS